MSVTSNNEGDDKYEREAIKREKDNNNDGEEQKSGIIL